jgi:ribose transport system ATP-binding protein/inositol transport system ATP-binding protein
MKSIHKSFPGVKALSGVNFELESGEIHALLGENGAGKSTLINILGGIYLPDDGEIYIEGKKADIHDVKSSQNHGIAIIHQELVLVPHMSIAENIFLGREPRGKMGVVDKKRMIREAADYLRIVGLEIPSYQMVNRLSIAQRQMVEIAKAISFNSKILIMDEPTSSLTEKEVQILFATMNRLRQEGVGIIYISHRISELFEVTDRVTVIRDGIYVGTKKTKETNTDELVAMMVGRNLENYYTRTFHDLGDVALEVRNIVRHGVFHGVSFHVQKGEILGFAGLVGAGRSEIFRSIIGIDPLDGGEIFINGRQVGRLTPGGAQDLGMVLVPEDRKKEGLILINSVRFNITLAVLRQFIKGISLNRKKEIGIVEGQARQLRVKAASYSIKVGSLSGGNQQKVVFGKILASNPDILVLDEPTRGIDVGAKADIYEIINNLAKKGISIIIISSELNEIINMCDRILVMHQGTISGSLMREDFSQKKIMQYATGTGGNEYVQTAANG